MQKTGVVAVEVMGEWIVAAVVSVIVVASGVLRGDGRERREREGYCGGTY